MTEPIFEHRTDSRLTHITEIDDARIIKGLAHPLRIHILRVLQERVASPSEIASGTDASLGTISYHVRYLERAGLITLTSTRAKRGAVEHYYRAVGWTGMSDLGWAQLPAAVRDGLIGSSLEQIGHVVSDAVTDGGFSRVDSQVARNGLRLDDQGFRELSAALGELVQRAHEIEDRSGRRLAEADAPGEEISSTLVVMLFDQATRPRAAIEPEAAGVEA